MSQAIVCGYNIHLDDDVVDRAEEVQGGEEVHHVSVHRHELAHVRRTVRHSLRRKVETFRLSCVVCMGREGVGAGVEVRAGGWVCVCGGGGGGVANANGEND